MEASARRSRSGRPLQKRPSPPWLSYRSGLKACWSSGTYRWILQGRVHTHTGPGDTVWWTAPAYAELAAARTRLEADADATARARAAGQARRSAAAHGAAAERRLQAALLQAQERRAEQERLAAFLEHAGMDAGVWPAFAQLLRTVSGKTVEYGGQSPAHGNGLLVYSRPHPGREFRLAGWCAPILKHSPGGRQS